MVWENALGFDCIHGVVSLNVMTMRSPPSVGLFACGQAVCYGYLKVLQVLGDEGSAVGYRQSLCVCLASHYDVWSLANASTSFAHTRVCPSTGSEFNQCFLSWPNFCWVRFALASVSLCLCFVFMNQLVLPAVHVRGL